MPSTPKRKRLDTARATRLALAALASAALLALPAASVNSRAQQQTGKPQRVEKQPEIIDDDDVLKIDTDLVLVEVTVTDAEGRPVRGLRPEDFKLYEDGDERAVAFLNVERREGAERPVAVVFAVDVSGSMTAEEMVRLQSAMRAFSEKLSNRPASFALMSFGMSARVLQSFTSDPHKLDHALERLAHETNGLSTHAYDAIDDAVRLLVRKAPSTRDHRLMKKAVVVVTDGFPVGDVVSPATVIERANEAEVSVYTVTLPSYSCLLSAASAARAPLPTPLDVSGLVEKTGGANVYATTKDYEPLFRALAEEVTSTYVLAFYPPEEKRRDGRSHTIRVEAPRGLTVRQNRTELKAAASDK
ncbi:MAG TPA: VWA domain-containing protein [Pyrinomonadaceae bacterium]|jgi:Ca-activated chloride channel family protein|nr:VWA domain-containing protein [Pyrinomonadaceae bacterium]